MLSLPSDKYYQMWIGFHFFSLTCVVPEVPPSEVSGGGGSRSELVITWDVSVWAASAPLGWWSSHSHGFLGDADGADGGRTINTGSYFLMFTLCYSLFLAFCFFFFHFILTTFFRLKTLRHRDMKYFAQGHLAGDESSLDCWLWSCSPTEDAHATAPGSAAFWPFSQPLLYVIIGKNVN